jgi:hypothetical protein
MYHPPFSGITSAEKDVEPAGPVLVMEETVPCAAYPPPSALVMFVTVIPLGQGLDVSLPGASVGSFSHCMRSVGSTYGLYTVAIVVEASGARSDTFCNCAPKLVSTCDAAAELSAVGVVLFGAQSAHMPHKIMRTMIMPIIHPHTLCVLFFYCITSNMTL